MFISEHTSSCMRVCMCIYRYIYCIHYAIYSDLHIISNFMYILHQSTVLLLLVLYCTFSEDSTCPGGPRHKPFGVS